MKYIVYTILIVVASTWAECLQAQCNISLGAITTQVSCTSASDGAIDLNVSGGTPPYNYEWSNGATDEDLIGIPVGVYVVTVTDQLGCMANLGRQINAISNPPLFSIQGSDPNITCFDAPNNYSTEVAVVPLGGGSPSLFSYAWSNGQTTSDLQTSAPGLYSVTVTNPEGCTAIKSIGIFLDTLPPTADAGLDQTISCAAPFVTLGGNSSSGAQIDYLWSGPGGNIIGATAVIAVTTPGLYRTTVTNTTNGCTATDAVTVSPASGYPVAVIQPPAIITCIQQQITLSGSGSSTGPEFSYLWSSNAGGIVSGANTLQAIVNQAGTYTLSVTNTSQNCTVSATVVVSSNTTPPAASAGPDKGIPCGGGTVQLEGNSNGSSQYQYIWNTADGLIIAGANTLQPVVALPGTYVMSSFDTNNGCSSTDKVKVFPGPAIPLQDFTINKETCTGQAGAAILITPPGLPPQTYAWSNGVTDQNLLNVSSGLYTVSVTDASPCTHYAEVFIPKDSATVQISGQVTPASCQSNSVGHIDISVTFGIGPFQYLWTTGSTNQDIDAMPGTYTVTVVESTQCTRTASFVMPLEGFDLDLQFNTVNPTCTANNGAIDLTPSGGSGFYEYDWSNDGMEFPPNDPQDLNNLAAGTYTVTLTDVFGCSTTASVTLNASSTIDITCLPPSPIGCNPVLLDISVTGGTPPYTYDWSNDGPEVPDNDTQDLLVFNPGAYTVTVTDANLCTATLSRIVTQYTPLDAIATAVGVSCNFGNDGSIDLTVTGGTGISTYLWSNNATTEDLNNLAAGTYTITVTDIVTGCTTVTSAIIDQPGTSFNLSVSSQNILCFGAATGAINLTVTGNNNGITFDWSNDGPELSDNDTEDLAGLTPGTYTVTVTDQGGCTASISASLSQPPSLPAVSTQITPATCGVANGTVSLTTTGGTAPYTFDWSNDGPEVPDNDPEDLSNLGSGLYTVTVTDLNGCTTTAEAQVNNIDGPVLQSTSSDVKCFGGADGSINLTPSAGTLPYEFLWSNGAASEDLNNLVAGQYTVTVTDGMGCTASFITVVNQPTDLVINVFINHVSCSGFSNGSIAFSANGGTPPYFYDWEHLSGANNPAGLNNIPAGTYTVTISDANGCSISQTQSINSPAPLPSDITSLSNNCMSEVLTGPNLAGALYTWTGPNGFTASTQVITASVSGVYSLTITDMTGCFSENSYAVNLAGAGPCGVLKGKVFFDETPNCALDVSESGLSGWLVRAEGNDTLYGVTNAQGNFHMAVPVGNYTIKALTPNNLWELCPLVFTAGLNMANDTVMVGNIPAKASVDCPHLNVSISSSILRRCFNDNQYHVSYCNTGTIKADDPYITIALDPLLSFVSSTVQSVNVGNNTRRYLIGDLNVGECGSFSIVFKVSCNAVLGQTLCTEAHIYPDSVCNTNPLWSGASLDVRGKCDADSLRFILKNRGWGGMQTVSEYIVVEDGVMYMSAPLTPLAAGDSLVLAVAANGSTWRMAVDQAPYHPYAGQVGVSVEGCSTNGSFSTGYVNQFATHDAADAVDVDCSTVVGAFDPNDKQGYPLGYGAAHYIRPDGDIEYLIRFQNTGTDTAFTVRIEDTLSVFLDPASIRPGVSSHAYRFDLTGEGVAHFIFENILLPDSNVNEPASQGFVRFSVRPRAGVPLETDIDNTASIYFDFNDAVLTNTTHHRLGENFITVGAWQPFLPGLDISVAPNPFQDEALLEIKGGHLDAEKTLQIFDIQGRKQRTIFFTGSNCRLYRKDLPAGVYTFNIQEGGRLLGSGKMIVE